MGTISHPIQTDEEHQAAMLRIQRLSGADIGTPEGDELNDLICYVVSYERKRWPELSGPGTPTTVRCVDVGDGEIGILIPDFALERMGLKLGDDVEMEIRKGAIVIRRPTRQAYHPSELPDRLKDEIRDARMAPEHEHLNRLMNDE